MEMKIHAGWAGGTAWRLQLNQHGVEEPEIIPAC